MNSYQYLALLTASFLLLAGCQKKDERYSIGIVGDEWDKGNIHIPIIEERDGIGCVQLSTTRNSELMWDFNWTQDEAIGLIWHRFGPGCDYNNIPKFSGEAARAPIRLTIKDNLGNTVGQESIFFEVIQNGYWLYRVAL